MRGLLSVRRRLPLHCIYIEAAENTNLIRISGGEALRQGLQHRLQPLHFLRVLRGSLPTDAITHGHGFEIASFNTSTLVKRKEDMLAPLPPGARPPVA